MATWLERYRNGEHEQVWAEMMAAGESIRHEPLFSDALAVARETMRRARQNVETLRDRLEQSGYQFAYPDEVITPPRPDVQHCIEELERRIGPLPLALRAWYEVVGAVNFMGRHPEWETHVYTDPLVVDPIDMALEEYQEWREECREYGIEEMGPYQLPVAPDYYHKADIASEPHHTIAVYRVVLPNPAADAPVGDEPHHTTFVNYLRTCFRWAGLPGLEHSEEHQEIVNRLVSELQPL
ncbi:MAG: hypothetical protein HXY39_19195 [Chloroflexi bacterium]|nr:hypothetical protein [Chloroflexota bacterium]